MLLQPLLCVLFQQLWIAMIRLQVKVLFYLNYGTGYIFFRMPANLKLVLTAILSVAAFFLQFRYLVACGRVAGFSG
jgi:hypothetical protein